MSILDTTDTTATTEAAKIPYTIFDAGVGQDFDSVYIHSIETPDGVFVTDGAALVHEEWCDTTTYDRVRYTDPRPIDADWWRSNFHTRTTNLVNDHPQVTIRPWYQITLEQAGADTTWRSYSTEALIALDQSRRIRAIIGAWTSPYNTTTLHQHRAAVDHLIETYSRHIPHMHPHHAALAALVAVDERGGTESEQLDPLEGARS